MFRFGDCVVVAAAAGSIVGGSIGRCLIDYCDGAGGTSGGAFGGIGDYEGLFLLLLEIDDDAS